MVRILRRRARAPITLALLGMLSSEASLGVAADQKPGLKIVVIEGENAVNIIQQKTAVRPVVEIRDENDLPVSGATVTFTITGGRTATFAGAQSVSVTTNAAGRATISALNPVTSGTVRMQVQAAFQSQTATATIAQTNVVTAAEAAAASGSGATGSSGGATSGAAGGSGGGLSGTTIGLVGAAVAGGTLVATRVAGGDDSVSGDVNRTFTGTYSGEMLFTGGCVRLERGTGTLRIRLTIRPDGSVTGTAGSDWPRVVVQVTNCQGPQPGDPSPSFFDGAPVTGSTSALSFFHRTIGSSQPGLTTTETWSFSGSLANDVVMGTWDVTESSQSPPGPPLTAAATFALTLRPER